MAKKDLSFLGSALIAHRGLHSVGVPENSLASFGAAVRKGYIIELDVHVLADGNVVVFHDDTLERICGVDVAIKDLTLRKIRKYRLAETEESIPLLKDILSLVNGAVPVVIELKYDAPVGVLEKALIPILNKYEGKYALKSFDPRIVRNLRKIFRDEPVGQLYSSEIFKDVTGFKKWIFKRAIDWSMRRSDFVSVDQNDLEEPIINTLRAFGKPILAWTIKSTDERLAAVKLADNCICEKIL